MLSLEEGIMKFREFRFERKCEGVNSIRLVKIRN